MKYQKMVSSLKISQERRNREIKNRWINYETNTKIIDLNVTILIITLNTNGLGIPIK